ncbi:hypothetical protein [Stakelama marina]|uniref:Uncharacterized protein n=1 Tax=Stakelama marina TaxID=2826939 RepID=A0A8T4IH15_9SPHN|nr:hypothetical protein [Stakelama marina]MBR0553923.1 hypothetical protein [Stakelama marina]
MFLRRQDLIDRFEANFRTGADGNIVFQPPRSKYSAPVSAEEYDAVIAAFERRQAIAQAATLIAFGAAGAYGIYQVIATADYGAFFIALGVAFAVSFALSFRDYTTLLQPFMERRDALRAASKKQENDC